MTSDHVIYLDNAATTRVSPDVASVVHAAMTEDYGNPASAHHFGIAAERRVKQARHELLTALADPDAESGDVYWTSGGTESDALAIMGAARASAGRGQHIVLSAIEHPAVRESARSLEASGWQIAVVPVEATGVVDTQRFVDAVTEHTTVAALMLVNNEIGTVQPVAEIAQAIRAAHPRVHVHCDAVQALGKIPVDVRALGVDSVAVSAHKFHGPKGVGALWLRKRKRVAPLWAGGGQQAGVRSGTLNVPGIAGMGEAVRLASAALAETQARFAQFGEVLVRAAEQTGIAYRRNGAGGKLAHHVVSLAFADTPAEPLLHVLESRGVLVSAGSACAERDRKPSEVLTGIGLPASFGTVRLSFGRDTTADDVRRAAAILTEAVRSFHS